MAAVRPPGLIEGNDLVAAHECAGLSSLRWLGAADRGDRRCSSARAAQDPDAMFADAYTLRAFGP